MHQHLYNLSQQLVALWRRICCCSDISKSVSCSSFPVNTAADATGSFHECWKWWWIGSTSTYVAPWSSLDDTPDQTLCLVEISLTHMKNIELSRWLVALVKGKRERHLSTNCFCASCDYWIMAPKWHWLFLSMYFILLCVWMWLKRLEKPCTQCPGTKSKYQPTAISLQSWQPKRVIVWPPACRIAIFFETDRNDAPSRLRHRKDARHWRHYTTFRVHMPPLLLA